MSRCRFPLFALSLAALPVGAAAQAEDAMAEVTGAQILACEADRKRDGCATLLSQVFVCDSAPGMAGCADLLALREAAVDMNEREADMNDAEVDEDIGIADEPEDDEIDVDVRAEGELADEQADEALNETAASEAVTPGNDTDAMACPVLDSADWAAWVNAMPGLDGPSLIVTGVVTLPTPGYSVTLEEGISDRSARPVQVVQLTAQPPATDAAQMLSDYDVRFEMPSPAPVDGATAPFTAVRVVCGAEEIARIEPVEVAQ